jgi:hypothetical protein
MDEWLGWVGAGRRYMTYIQGQLPVLGWRGYSCRHLPVHKLDSPSSLPTPRSMASLSPHPWPRRLPRPHHLRPPRAGSRHLTRNPVIWTIGCRGVSGIPTKGSARHSRPHAFAICRCRWSKRTHGHLNPEELEDPALLAGQLLALFTQEVRVGQARHAADEGSVQPELAELRLHAVREWVARGRVGVGCEDRSFTQSQRGVQSIEQQEEEQVSDLPAGRVMSSVAGAPMRAYSFLDQDSNQSTVSPTG